MRYLAPFEVIKKLVEISTSGGQLVAAATYEDLIKMINSCFRLSRWMRIGIYSIIPMLLKPYRTAG